jgi:hypothetical protein
LLILVRIAASCRSATSRAFRTARPDPLRRFAC